MKKYTPETGALETAALETDRTKIMLATLSAFIGAALIFVTFILPAEFNRDPLGIGKQLGILGLSKPSSTAQTVSIETTNYQEDSVSFQLLPFESIEYKYQLRKGSVMLYSWTTTDTVAFEFHGEPEGGPEGFAETFSIGKADSKNGTFTAPFNGIHGWYWENRGTKAVTVNLTTAGFYTASLEFRDGGVSRKVLQEKSTARKY